LNGLLEKGQRVALRVATGSEEREFRGIVRSFDGVQGQVSVEVEEESEGKITFLLGREATLVGEDPKLNIDFPCVVSGESRFPMVICQRANRRNHVRVNAFLPLKYRHLSREEYDADPEGCFARVQDEMGGLDRIVEVSTEELAEGSLDPRLLSLLTEMNRKLDRILAVLQRGLEGQSSGHLAVNISGSGVRFTVGERIRAGILLAVRIALPLAPPIPVVFIGEVTRVRDKGKGDFEIAVRFVAIDEEDREQIVHYTFKRMRESVRNRTEEGVSA
jgi:c-di-GMP-binding flagellar brake protein YcgR